MAEYHHLRVFTPYTRFQRFGRAMRIHDVVDEEFPLLQFHDFGQAIAEGQVVGVAQDGGDRGNLFESLEDFWKTDIPPMQDVVDAGEQRGDSRIQEVVGIRNDPDPHKGLRLEGGGAMGQLSGFAFLGRGFAFRGFGVLFRGFLFFGGLRRFRQFHGPHK